MIKRMTFVRRASSLRPDEFADRWRAQAREERESAPAGVGPARLAHCLVREGRTPPAHHGVAIAWFDNADSLARYDAWRADRTANGAARVEDEGSSTSVLVEERTVFGDAWLEERWSGPPATPTLLLLGFIEAAPQLSQDQFRDYWWGTHRPLANRLIPVPLQPRAYVHDYVLAGQPTRWAGVGEMYDDSLDVARQRSAWFDTEDARSLVADEERFLVRTTRELLITSHEVITNSS
jgi:EthD domain